MHMVNVLRESKGSQPSLMALVGFEDWSLPTLLTGAAGAICGLLNIAPELFNGLVRTFEAATSRKRRSCTGASSPLWQFSPWAVLASAP
jgi:dihydrodipicolinate synthase/N-acetylneuraminate lyase